MAIKDLRLKAIAFDNFFKALKELRNLGVLINGKDFNCQIGEWLVEVIYEGKRASNGIQRGWDVEVNGNHIQVKTHAKADSNKAGFSAVEKESTERIDELIIVLFTYDYRLKALYKVPWIDALPLIQLRGKKMPRNEIRWSNLKKYKIEKDKLPHQEIVELF